MALNTTVTGLDKPRKTSGEIAAEKEDKTFDSSVDPGAGNVEPSKFDDFGRDPDRVLGEEEAAWAEEVLSSPMVRDDGQTKFPTAPEDGIKRFKPAKSRARVAELREAEIVKDADAHEAAKAGDAEVIKGEDDGK